MGCFTWDKGLSGCDCLGMPRKWVKLMAMQRPIGKTSQICSSLSACVAPSKQVVEDACQLAPSFRDLWCQCSGCHHTSDTIITNMMMAMSGNFQATTKYTNHKQTKNQIPNAYRDRSVYKVNACMLSCVRTRSGGCAKAVELMYSLMSAKTS